MVRLIIFGVGVVFLVIAIGLIGLYLQIPKYKSYWEKRSSQPVSKNSLRYVALGDSAAQGIGATSPMKGYVGLVAKALEDKYRQPVHITNLSRTGARIQDCIREQVPKLSDVQADFITVEIGANDMQDFEPSRFEAQMAELMSSLPKHTIISNMPYFGGGRYRNLEPHVKQANVIISRLTDEYQLTMADLYLETKQKDGLGTMTIDLLHPSNKGYKNWFQAFWLQLQKKGDEL